ncbi:MAG TPA: aminoacyl-tRNA hydrolase [Sphingobacteriaceae bacterium]|nr:aminoacyl-tRNA hydrolase [Sphingobacteriaceae bacterium]
MEFTEDDLIKEVVFKTSRSGGKGGQNVNKVASKVEINFNVQSSELFSEDEKKLLLSRFANRLSVHNSIRVVSQEDRSQLSNKHTAIKKLYFILSRALQVDIPRKVTKPKKSVIEKRLKLKQQIAEKKIRRRRDFY